jgi:membrane protein implicated in regulation of membrane protease activity
VLSITLWGIVALSLLILELVTGTLILLFFAIAAAVTAMAALAGIEALHWQLVVFGLCGIASLGLFRKKLLERTGHGSPTPSADVGETVVAESEIAPQGEGIVTYQGAPWTVINVGATAIARGQRARIVRTEGVRLFVEAVP